MSFSLIIMYSASGKDLAMMDRQAFRMGLSIILMLVAAQIPPRTYQAVAPYLFIIGVFMQESKCLRVDSVTDRHQKM